MARLDPEPPFQSTAVVVAARHESEKLRCNYKNKNPSQPRSDANIQIDDVRIAPAFRHPPPSPPHPQPLPRACINTFIQLITTHSEYHPCDTQPEPAHNFVPGMAGVRGQRLRMMHARHHDSPPPPTEYYISYWPNFTSGARDRCPCPPRSHRGSPGSFQRCSASCSGSWPARR